MKTSNVSHWKLILHVAAILPALAAGCSRAAGATGDKGEQEEKVERKPFVGDRVRLSAVALQSVDLSYAKATIRKVSPSLVAPAELTADPDRRATVGPRVAGRVIAVRVTSGHQVKAGDPLVVLTSQAVGVARAALLSAWVRLRVSKQAAQRAKRLADRQIIAVSELEVRKGNLRLAWADVMAARTRLSAFGVPGKELRFSGDPARVVLRSPLSGTVVARRVHIGRWVKPEDVLVEVIDLSELWLQAEVYERDLRQIHVGQSVQVEVRAYPGQTFHGKVAVIGSTLDRLTRRARVRIVLPNPDRRLKPGMFATARIAGTGAGGERRLLSIPWSAVQHVDGHLAVFVRTKPGLFHLRKIHTGGRAGRYVEVVNGLRAGETVVTQGSFLLKGELLKSSLGEDE